MKKNIFIVIAICALVAESSDLLINRTRRNVGTCGVPKATQGLIIRGQNFPRGSFPWIIALLHTGWNPPKFFCAGTLITKTFVISAAHCILQKQATEKFLPRDMLAIFGAHDLSNPYEAGRFQLSPRKIYVHNDWNSSSIQYDADLSLLEFEDGSIHFNAFVQPICLFYSESEPPVTEGIVTGWGKSEDPNKITEIKPKLIKARIQSNEQCFLESKALVDLSSQRTFCAGLKNGSGVCTGDSGGGLFIKKDYAYHLSGIVSSSLVKNDGCDVERNAVYTNVLRFEKWIVETTRSLREVFCTFVRVNAGINSCEVNQAIDSETYVLGSEFNTTVEKFNINEKVKVLYVPRNIGEKFPNLKEFKVRRCSLTVLRDHYFKNMQNLQELDASHNHIRGIESEAFKDLVSLKSFYLSHNMVETVPEKLFVTMVNLENIWFLDNKIKFLNPTTFNIPGGKVKIVNLQLNICIHGAYDVDFVEHPGDSMIIDGGKKFERLEPDLKANCNLRSTISV